MREGKESKQPPLSLPAHHLTNNMAPSWHILVSFMAHCPNLCDTNL